MGGSIAAILNIIVGEIENWRLLFGVGLLGIFALICLRRNIPESPRWLLLQGRREEALEIVFQIESCVQEGSSFLKER